MAPDERGLLPPPFLLLDGNRCRGPFPLSSPRAKVDPRARPSLPCDPVGPCRSSVGPLLSLHVRLSPVALRGEIPSPAWRPPEQSAKDGDSQGQARPGGAFSITKEAEERPAWRRGTQPGERERERDRERSSPSSSCSSSRKKQQHLAREEEEELGGQFTLLLLLRPQGFPRCPHQEEQGQEEGYPRLLRRDRRRRRGVGG